MSASIISMSKNKRNNLSYDFDYRIMEYWRIYFQHYYWMIEIRTFVFSAWSFCWAGGWIWRRSLWSLKGRLRVIGANDWAFSGFMDLIFIMICLDSNQSLRFLSFCLLCSRVQGYRILYIPFVCSIVFPDFKFIWFCY